MAICMNDWDAILKSTRVQELPKTKTAAFRSAVHLRLHASLHSHQVNLHKPKSKIKRLAHHKCCGENYYAKDS